MDMGVSRGATEALSIEEGEEIKLNEVEGHGKEDGVDRLEVTTMMLRSTWLLE